MQWIFTYLFYGRTKRYLSTFNSILFSIQQRFIRSPYIMLGVVVAINFFLNSYIKEYYEQKFYPVFSSMVIFVIILNHRGANILNNEYLKCQRQLQTNHVMKAKKKLFILIQFTTFPIILKRLLKIHIFEINFHLIFVFSIRKVYIMDCQNCELKFISSL